MGFVVLFVILLPFVALVLVSLPPKTGMRLKFSSKEPISVPPLCVVTGETATEAHVVQSFSGNPYYIEKKEVTLPFSAGGWETYQKTYPLSLKAFKGGLAALTKVPLLGAYLAIYMWVPWAGVLCGIFAAVEILLHKRQLVILNGIKIRGDALCGIDILGANIVFAEEFLRLNGNIALAEYRTEYARKVRLRNIALVVGGSLALLFVVVLLLDLYGVIHVFPR